MLIDLVMYHGLTDCLKTEKYLGFHGLESGCDHKRQIAIAIIIQKYHFI
ncbi:MAG: hypothetical protein HRU34_15605 [Richelia sp.]|nr:hypothetical protein [Richelia sp.]